MTIESAEEEEKAKQHVARIGNVQVSAEELLERMLVRRDWKSIERSLDSFLIESAFEKYQIETNEEELRSQITLFRQKNGLMSGDETHKWLTLHHLDDHLFLKMCEYELKEAKLKEILFADKLEEYFVYRRSNLVSVELYKIVVEHEEAAREIVSSIKEGASFFDYARKYSIDMSTSKSCGYAGKCKLNTLSPFQQDLISKAKVGGLIGPVKTNKSFEIYLLAHLEQPVFDGELRQELQDELFEQWLNEAKSRLHIEFSVEADEA